MKTVQPGILTDDILPARYLSFSINSVAEVKPVLQLLVDNLDMSSVVVGMGESLVSALGQDISGLKTLTAQVASGIEIPSTPAALWCWLKGADPGDLFHRSREIESLLLPAFSLDEVIDSFHFDENRDLSGYEDGTENPEGDEAIAAAIVQGQGAGMDGSSFVAVQQWLHDFETFDSMSVEEQDNTFGRHISDNEEFDEAPESAHVKRAAQESFDPEAFVLRRSMPWSDGMSAGLVFVAFGHSFDAFEAILTRMLGKEDGISDALFDFTRPVTGAYYWCPPMKDNKLDLSILGF